MNESGHGPAHDRIQEKSYVRKQKQAATCGVRFLGTIVSGLKLVKFIHAGTNIILLLTQVVQLSEALMVEVPGILLMERTVVRGGAGKEMLGIGGMEIPRFWAVVIE